MLARRYGNRIHMVRPRFDAHALTEVAFERLAESWPADEWLSGHQKLGEHSLTAAAEGDVKDDAEKELLVRLQRRLDALEAAVPAGALLLVENGRDDHPKTRDTTREVPNPLGNRLHFSWRVDPPLRVGVYAPRLAS
jgi:hypothetical protein